MEAGCTSNTQKKFFEVSTYQDLLVLSFQIEQKKLVVYFGLYESSLHFSEDKTMRS